MAQTSLPPQERTAAVRVHRMRVARGACWAISLALMGAFTLTLLDAVAELPDWARGLGLAIWLTGSGVLVWSLVVRRWQLRWARHPLRAAEAELPGNIQAAATATLALALSLLAAFVLPNASAHICRMALPWYRQAGGQFRVVVTSNEPVVRVGEVVTFSAYVEKLDPSAAAPENAVVHCRDSAGNQTSIQMDRDATGAFHAASPPTASDFSYRIEVQGSSSDWLAVTAIQPAEPADGTVLEITPPAYASQYIPRQTLRGFLPFTALQYSKVELVLKLSRPATHAFLKWEPEGGAAEVVNIALTPDGQAGTATFTAKQDGMLRLATGAERNGKMLASTTSVKVKANADTPPRFERVRGVSQFPLFIQPGHTLAIEFVAVDDIAVGEATLEYTIAGGNGMRSLASITLTRTSPTTAQGRLDFDLPGKLREGESLRYRLVTSDTRRLAEPMLGSQSIAYPESGWASVTVLSTASPVEEQEIENQRLFVHQDLDKIARALRELQVGVETLGSDTRIRFELDHEVRLDRLRKSRDELVRLLKDLAREASLTVELRSLASQFQEVADQPLRQAGDSLRTAWTDSSAARSNALAQAVTQFLVASDSLARLQGRNGRLAAARLDVARLWALRSEQLSLAQRLKADAAPTPELIRLERELSQRLAHVVGESQPLSEAMAYAQRVLAVRFSRKLSGLAENIRDLDEASKELDREARAAILDAIAADCAAAAKATAALLAKIEQPARLAGVSLPKPEEAHGAVELIAAGKTVEALTKLQQLIESLKGVAAPLEKWASDGSNAKVACHQFAAWQDDLRTRIRTAISGKDQEFGALPPADQDEFRKEQAAIANALRGLKLPPLPEVVATRDSLVKQLTALEDRLKKPTEGTDAAMTSAAAALNQLADRIPSIAERLAWARDELDKLQSKQDAILRSIEEAIGKPDVSVPGATAALAMRLKQHTARQQEQLTAFSALDLPGEEIRRSRILAALQSAEADLDCGAPYDIFASQHWVKREFERLRSVLRRNASPEDVLDQLASRLRNDLKALEADGAGRARDPFAANSENFPEIHRQLQHVAQLIPEAAVLRNDALEAVRVLMDTGFQKAATDQERRARLNLAIENIRRLVERVRGHESDLQRIQRFAASRQTAAERAPQKLGNPVNRKESDEAREQLSREADELLYSRVGVANQILKQRALARYAQLKAYSEPDRNAALQNELSEILNELAARMADLPHLALTPPAPVLPQESHEADRYLPSGAAAEQLLGLARRFQTNRERLNHLGEEQGARTTAAEASPFVQLERNQRELARDIAQLAERLAHEPVSLERAQAATASAYDTAELLANGRARLAKESAMAAARSLRSLDQFGDAKELALRQERIASEVSDLIGNQGVGAAQQRLRAGELARRAHELALELHRTFGVSDPEQATRSLIAEAEKGAIAVARLLADAASKTASGQRLDAEKSRGAAIKLLDQHAAKLGGGASEIPRDANPAILSCAEVLRSAAAEMRTAIDLLGADKPAEASEVMLKAASDLESAMRIRLEAAR